MIIDHPVLTNEFQANVSPFIFSAQEPRLISSKYIAG
jgi:hypothetical protein